MLGIVASLIYSHVSLYLPLGSNQLIKTWILHQHHLQERH